MIISGKSTSKIRKSLSPVTNTSIPSIIAVANIGESFLYHALQGTRLNSMFSVYRPVQKAVPEKIGQGIPFLPEIFGQLQAAILQLHNRTLQFDDYLSAFLPILLFARMGKNHGNKNVGIKHYPQTNTP